MMFKEYADFGLRFIATAIDFIWMVTVIVACFYFLLGMDVLIQLLHDEQAALQGIDWQTFLLSDGLPFLLTLFFWMRYGATPGKMIADCKIVNATTGQPISLLQAIVRYFAYLVSALPLGLGFLWIIWDKKKQGWHDKIANTVVVMHDEMDVPLSQLVNK